MNRLLLLGCAATLLAHSELRAQGDANAAARDAYTARHERSCNEWRAALSSRDTASLHDARYRDLGCEPPHDSVIVGLWRAIGSDTSALTALVHLTTRTGGPRLLHTVLGIASDAQRAPLVRIAALAAVVPYVRPNDICATSALDTLRPAPNMCAVDHPSYDASSSIEPLLRDSIWATLAPLREERGVVGRAAKWLGPSWLASERWNEEDAAWCRRSSAAFGPALRMSQAVFLSDELYKLATCSNSGPPALLLAWQAAPPDSVVLSHLVRMSATVRDARVYRALLATARDPARPVAVRVAAVDAIAPLLHPALYWYQTASAHAHSPDGCSIWGWASHEAVQEEGPVPMGHASRRGGVAELRRLSAEDVPPPVREAAQSVAKCAASLLDSRMPETW